MKLPERHLNMCISTVASLPLDGCTLFILQLPNPGQIFVCQLHTNISTDLNEAKERETPQSPRFKLVRHQTLDLGRLDDR